MQVALNAAKAGESETVLGVLEDVEENYFKVGWDSFGNYTIDSPLYEYNLFNLKNEFISDWNKFSGKDWTDFVVRTFWDDAKIGVTSSTNLSGSKIYNFFNDPEMKVKWGWFLDYLIDGAGDVHPNKQANAIKGDGTYNNDNLYSAEHFCYTIYNFFNKVHTAGPNYYGADFTKLNKYNSLPNYQKGVFASYDKYEFVKLGNSIILPNAPEKSHYSFVNYAGGLDVGSSVTVSKSTKYTPQYTPIQYSVKFFDGENELMSLEETYTIEAGITLPDYEKDGYTFEGWYETEDLEGLPITFIPTGTTGDKVYYAKTTLNTVEPFTINYNLDGGHWTYATREDMVNAFLDDYTAFYNRVNNASLSRVTLLVSGDPGYDASTALVGRMDNENADTYKVFSDTEFYNKWIWIIEYTRSIRTSGQADFTALINKTATASSSTVKYEIWAFLSQRYRSSWPASSDYTNQANANGFWDLYFAQSEFNYNDIVNTLPTPYKEGYTFSGWYDTEDFSGSQISSVSTNKTLYAKWIAD